MEREELGPNGGVLWAMEEVDANFEWLEECLEDCGVFTLSFDFDNEPFADYGQRRLSSSIHLARQN